MNEQLRGRLRTAVPQAPDLTGLAGRAEAQGRRRRTTLRTAAGTGAAALVAAAVLIPGLFGDAGDPSPAPSPVPSTPACVAQSEVDGTDLTAGTASWVRFCGRADGQTGIARFPDGALTGELAKATVAGWEDSLGDSARCQRDAVSGRSFRIQVGFVDGTVAQHESVTGTDCSGELLYTVLLTRISSELDQRYEDVVRPPETCPTGLRTDRTNTDGESAELLVGSDPVAALSTRPLLALNAQSAQVCRYLGHAGSLRLDDSWSSNNPGAEGIRVSAFIDYTDGQADCPVDPQRPSYVVMLRDKTGTTRTFSIDGAECGAMSAAIGTPAEEQYLGLASPDLIQAIESSRGS
jgi:hypothetical protein